MAIQTYTVPSDRIVHNTKVDFSQRCVQKVIHVVQYDKSLPVIAVQLFLNGSTYTLPANSDVKIRWGKKDHTFIYKNVLGCDSARQTVYFDVDEQMTYFNGPCNPILELIISGNKAGSSYIPFEIDRNPVQNTDIESHSVYPELEEAVEKAEEAAEVAKTSEDNAKTSETNAATSEANALAYKNSAESAVNGFNTKVNTAKEEIEAVKTEDISAINSAKDSAVSTVNSTKDSAVSSVNSTKDTAVTAVNDKKTEGVNAVQEVIDSIPEDYQTLSSDVTVVKGKIDNIERKIGKEEITDLDWDEIVNNISKGYGSSYFLTGDQFLIPYVWSGTTYSNCPHNIVDHSDEVILGDDEEEHTVHAMTLEWHYTIPLGLAYDPSEALAEISENGLPAGKYCVKIAGDSWGSKNGLIYSFTLPEALTEGMQLKPSGSYDSKSSISFTMMVYQDGKSFTALHNVQMTLETELPSDATYLGSYGGDDYDSSIKECFKSPYEKSGVDRILNHYHCVYLGCNVWKWSLYRQWLNGDSDWVWTSQHPCDRAPSNYATLSGFLSGYSEDFKKLLKPRKCITYRNTTMFENRYDVTYDKVFLHSMANINVDGFDGSQNTGKLEGNAWEYYKKLAEGQSNLNANGTFKAWTTYEILKKYTLNAQTSAQNVFARSALRSYGYGVLFVNASGYVSGNNAFYGSRCLPACIIAGTATE